MGVWGDFVAMVDGDGLPTCTTCGGIGIAPEHQTAVPSLSSMTYEEAEQYRCQTCDGAGVIHAGGLW